MIALLEPGDTLGDWIVVKPLGEGGMGTVYLAHHMITPRVKAALKVIKPRDHRPVEGRFTREVEALSQLHHESVVGIKGWGVDPVEGLFFLAMDYLKGRELRTIMDRGPLSVPRALYIIGCVVDGLAHAHGKGIFHRDIKPSNVILCEDGRVVVLDFGLAIEDGAERLTIGRIVGTTAYLPPEVLTAEPVDFAIWDIYSTGLVLYEMLTGARVFRDYSVQGPSLLRAVMEDKSVSGPLDPGDEFPDELREVIRMATHPDQHSRLDSMVKFRALLDRVDLAGLGSGPTQAKVTVLDTQEMESASASEEVEGLVGDWTAILRSTGSHRSLEETPDHGTAVTQHPRLVFHTADNNEQVVPLVREALSVGRGPENDISVIKDNAMSRRHLELRRDGDCYTLVDRGSSNGTLLNGSPVHLARLRHGDIFQAGRTCFMYLSE